MSTAQIISKASSFCNALRDDGVVFDDYLEQLPGYCFEKWQRNCRYLLNGQKNFKPGVCMYQYPLLPVFFY